MHTNPPGVAGSAITRTPLRRAGSPVFGGITVARGDPISADLHTEIKSVCDLMIRVHYFDEANWLWMAVASPESCASLGARAALQSARRVAAEFGFPHVAQFVTKALAADTTDASMSQRRYGAENSEIV